jgi:hypothetical protein
VYLPFAERTMSGLFKPKIPKIEPPPPAPVTDEAKMREIQSGRQRKKRGRMATMVSSAESQAQGQTGTTKLLGGGMG